MAQIFIREIVRFHGDPKNIILDIDSKFTSTFLKEFFLGLGTELSLITTYHMYIDGKKKRFNRILKDMLRMYVMQQKRK